MTAPDPGLTDLIAAHRLKQSYWNWWGCTGCDWRTKGTYGSEPTTETATEHAKHVVEQHTNGRIAELEAERDQAIAHDRQPYPTAWAYEQACAALEKHRERAEKAEAAIARVEAEAALLERMIRTAPWSRYTEVRRSHLRSLGAALEGPGEAG